MASALNQAILASQSQDTHPRLLSMLKLMTWSHSLLNSRGVPTASVSIGSDDEAEEGGATAMEP
jgi:hypothetical protein